MTTASDIANRLRRLPPMGDLVRAELANDVRRSRAIQDEYEAAIFAASTVLEAAELALATARDGLAEAARQRAALQAELEAGSRAASTRPRSRC